MDYTLYQPEEVKETDIDEVTVDRCIKVVEDLDSHGKQSEIMRKELVQALKNLKNKYETKNN